ncbi:MAG: hypothetical protein R3A80_08320 [Bdellovibrionota bacterium]
MFNVCLAQNIPTRAKYFFQFVIIVLLSSCENPFLGLKPLSGGDRARVKYSGAGKSIRGAGFQSGGHNSRGASSNEGTSSGGLFNSSKNLGPTSTNGKVVVTLPRDRCKAGTIVFGNTKCQAVGRGLTSHSGAPDSRYIKGYHSTGQPCWYLSSKYENGATPASRYTLGEIRTMGSDKRHWGQSGIRLNDNVPGRDGFVVHSVNGFYENTNAEVQNGYGCVRISQECMTKLHQYRSSNGSGIPFEVNEI